MFKRFFNRRIQGDAYELRARRFLESHGLTFVTANWRTPQGEIDLVMRDDSRLIFIEVRQRNSSVFGGALASIDPAKQARLGRTVERYLAQLPKRPDYRVDAVVFEADNVPRWVKNVLA